MHYALYRGVEGGTTLGWTGMIGGFFMMVFWVLVVYMIISMLRRPHGMGHHCMGHGDMRSDPLDILRERYAKGEIDRKEFEEKKKDLS